jgi:hypothetical protein
MTIGQELLNELTLEAEVTRLYLARVFHNKEFSPKILFK